MLQKEGNMKFRALEILSTHAASVAAYYTREINQKACGRLLVSADYLAKNAGKQRKNKWVKTVKKREGGAWIPKAAYYLAHSQKSCTSCQNVKMYSVGEFHKLAMFVCVCEAKFRISVDVNCQGWLIIGYTSGWYTGMRYWKWCL